MRNWKFALPAAVLIAFPAAVQAQSTGGTASSAEVESDRLAAATQLVSLMLPATQRDAMVDQMMQSIMSTMIASLKGQPEIASALEHPKVEAVFNRFLDRQRQLASDQLKAEMPGMLTAMSRAYARRFTTPQLAELHAFFGTPTGQLYARESSGILSDPDIVEWQRNLMTKSFARYPDEIKALMTELENALAEPVEEPKA